MDSWKSSNLFNTSEGWVSFENNSEAISFCFTKSRDQYCSQRSPSTTPYSLLYHYDYDYHELIIIWFGLF